MLFNSSQSTPRHSAQSVGERQQPDLALEAHQTDLFTGALSRKPACISADVQKYASAGLVPDKSPGWASI